MIEDKNISNVTSKYKNSTHIKYYVKLAQLTPSNQKEN